MYDFSIYHGEYELFFCLDRRARFCYHAPMKKLLSLGLAAITLAAFAQAAPPKKSVPPSDWILTWSDEFNGSKVDATKWNVYDRLNSYNNELQYYSPDEVQVGNGTLKLTSHRRDVKGKAYTSGAVNTLGKFAQPFGKWEIRAKLPGTKGIWPAIWLLPADETWPPEIDIMELLGHEPNVIHMTNHWKDSKGAHQSKGGPFSGPDFTKAFHTYAIEWEPGKIRWLVDGVERFVSTEGVPDGPFYLILNTAVGGDWPGNPDTTTVFPQTQEIDWVRVYRKRGSKPYVYKPTPPFADTTFKPSDLHLDVTNGAAGTGTIEDGAFKAVVTKATGTDWHAGVSAFDVNLQKGETYTLAFRAKTDRAREIVVYGFAHGGDYHGIGLKQTAAVTPDWKTFAVTFTAQNVVPGKSRAPSFQLGDAVGTVWLADVTLKKATP